MSGRRRHRSVAWKHRLQAASVDLSGSAGCLGLVIAFWHVF